MMVISSMANISIESAMATLSTLALSFAYSKGITLFFFKTDGVTKMLLDGNLVEEKRIKLVDDSIVKQIEVYM